MADVVTAVRTGAQRCRRGKGSDRGKTLPASGKVGAFWAWGCLFVTFETVTTLGGAPQLGQFCSCKCKKWVLARFFVSTFLQTRASWKKNSRSQCASGPASALQVRICRLPRTERGIEHYPGYKRKATWENTGAALRLRTRRASDEPVRQDDTRHPETSPARSFGERLNIAGMPLLHEHDWSLQDRSRSHSHRNHARLSGKTRTRQARSLDSVQLTFKPPRKSGSP